MSARRSRSDDQSPSRRCRGAAWNRIDITCLPSGASEGSTSVGIVTSSMRILGEPSVLVGVHRLLDVVDRHARPRSCLASVRHRPRGTSAAPRAPGSPWRSRPAGGCSPNARPRRDSAPPDRTGAGCASGSAADTTSDASISVPSASVTPRTRPSFDRMPDDLGRRCAHRRRRAFAADSSALASAPVPPRANTAVPAAPPSLPAESFRNTAAVPVAHGPIDVNSTPRVASGPRTASSSKTSWTRSATAIGSARIASRPVFAPRSRNAFPSFSPMIASAIDGLFASGGVATLT